ncbi:NAD(P)H-hydrate dehydratase [Lactiplantibacillus mudanjiangensis]|uniref:ADP-dependent (S)-NAD(P)H-hydrate dehydratase n=1 Tax=Lactiplantibacillus mudanjiangensis TaxID=1296538 RepID=A0A660E730_9LACO|nr:NAD(P)H-hydrate dehydratase [Lactiplantibacillus mudanjiangensis]VDG25913.1 NAD(P)H-hydrate dehydratase [Lactobacillus pentosus] [Lactiplantibacillus mudanjiangensis]VDG28863.1 NAD(P)H-hydrate dehydratase [Lactobacillus pentosus] [Lactiplantibacillus mudanjiangensis]VDG33744.1 NAD(P)H-hydrate dehydratase [Lactobacillus pentosus] [Lactiplantibacillus mudanjiangensis]
MKPITSALVAQTITPRPADSHKGTYGRLLLIGGNQNFGGAIIMAATAAVYSGAGLVTVATDPENFTSLHAQLPEAMVVDYTDLTFVKQQLKSATVIVIGPGLGTDDLAKKLLTTVLTELTATQRLVIDGSAITLLATHSQPLPAGSIVVTPHQMEWQRLSGLAIVDQTPTANLAAAQQLGVTAVVKSHQTTIYQGISSWQNIAGTPAMATGGMGDTLAGMVGGFSAQFTDFTKAILSAVYVHSQIADDLAQKKYVVLPHQITPLIPQYLHRYSQK